MLDEAGFLAWAERLGFDERARGLVAEIRCAPPSRRVRGGARNVTGFYPSRKMGCTVQFESHRVELAAVYAMEHDPAVLEYYDQPPAIKLLYRSPKGRSLGVVHTPDFFVLRVDGAGWEEWKAEEALLRLSASSPNRYVRDPDGGWRCPPGEAYASDYGLGYSLRSSSSIDWVLQRNLCFLEDYLRTKLEPAPEPREEISAAVFAVPGVTLADLLAGVRVASADDVFAAIARGDLYVDLSAAPLTEPSRVRVFRDRALVIARRALG